MASIAVTSGTTVRKTRLKDSLDFTVDSIANIVEDTTPQLGGDLDSNGSDIIMADNDKIFYGTGSDATILYDGTDLVINPDAVGSGDLKISSQQLILTKTGSTQRLVMDRPEIAGDGTNIGSFRATSLNSSSVSKNFAQIFFRMEDSTVDTEDGSIKFNTLLASNSIDFIIINDAGSGNVLFNGDVDINAKELAVDTTKKIYLSGLGSDTYIHEASTNVIQLVQGGNIISLPTGTETLLANIIEDITPQLGGDLDLNGKNIDFPTTANIGDCLDEDNMASDSATSLATQQSIKAYVDSQLIEAKRYALMTGNN